MMAFRVVALTSACILASMPCAAVENGKTTTGTTTITTTTNTKTTATANTTTTNTKAILYVLGTLGEQYCPSGYTWILDLATCQAAGVALGGTDNTAYAGGHHGAAKEIGCTVNTNNNNLHFNVDNLGTTIPGDIFSASKYVCKKATTATAPATTAAKSTTATSTTTTGNIKTTANSTGIAIVLDIVLDIANSTGITDGSATSTMATSTTATSTMATSPAMMTGASSSTTVTVTSGSGDGENMTTVKLASSTSLATTSANEVTMSTTAKTTDLSGTGANAASLFAMMILMTLV